MIQKMIVYKDTKLGVYTKPMFIEGDRSREDIIEMTRRMCANPNLDKAMLEYDLYEIGEYDDKICKITSHEPLFLVSLGDFRHLASEPEKVDVVG